MVLSGGSLRSPPAKHSSTPSGPQVLRCSCPGACGVSVYSARSVPRCVWRLPRGLRGSCPGACAVCRAACEVRAPVHVPFAARPAVPVHGSCAPVISPPRTGGPEGVQPCLAPGERSEPGGLCGLSIASAPFQGSNGTRRRTTVPVCYWTTLGPGTGSCLYSGVRRRGEACPCPQFRRPQELPLHMQSPPPLSTRQLLPHKMYRRVRT